MKLSSGKPLFAVILLASLLPLSVAADQTAKQSERTAGERYSITEIDGNILRLDQRTGDIAICKPENGKLACKLGFDERHAYQQEIDRINQRLDKVLVRLDALESGKPGTTNKARKPASEEEEFDRALKFADKAFRHFFGMVQELKKERKKDAI